MSEQRSIPEHREEDATHHVVLGRGPVGAAVADELVARGARVTIVTRSGASRPGAESLRADLRDPIAAKDALATADVVYQSAQPPYHRWPEEFPALQASIVDATEAAAAVLVVVENLYGYGPVDGPIHEDLPLAATGRKGETRARMWHDLSAAHEAGRIRAVAARAADFYGPGVTASSFGERLFGPLVRGRRAEVLGDPTTRHSVTYVPDLARAMVRLGAEPDAWGRAWHVPTAPAVTTEQFVTLAADAAGTSPRIRTLGARKLRLAGIFVPAARELAEMLHEYDRDFVVDDSAFTERFGGPPTPLTTGLAATVDWYREQAS